MSRSSVRHQAATFISNANIPGIGTVYASPPKISRSSDALANAPAGTESASVIYIEILESEEVRVAFGGPIGGKKMVTHLLRIHLLFRSRQAKAEDAMDDYDTQIEALLELLRSDRTMGTTNGQAFPVFENGEGPAGIKVATGMPKDTGGGSTIIWSIVDLETKEFIQA